MLAVWHFCKLACKKTNDDRSCESRVLNIPKYEYYMPSIIVLIYFLLNS